MRLATLALSSVLLAVAGPALADRPPTPEELTRIEASLRGAGFTGWKEIEFDDRRFEVDDATLADGSQWDLKLDPQSFAIVSRERD